MKYLSHFTIVIVIVLISWSSVSSINLIMNRNIKYIDYMPKSVKRSINQFKYNLVDSMIDSFAKDLNI